MFGKFVPVLHCTEKGCLCHTHSIARGVVWKKESVLKAIETGNICIKLVNEIRFGHSRPKASHLQAVGIIFQDDTKGNFLGFHFCYMAACCCGNCTKDPGWISCLTFRPVGTQVLHLLRKRLEI